MPSSTIFLRSFPLGSLLSCSRLIKSIRYLPLRSRSVSRSDRYSQVYGVTKLSPQEVSTILRANEVAQEVHVASIRSFDANQLSSNSPIEDRICLARCCLTTGYLFGVFDGHGGSEVAHLVNHRLFDYIALGLLPAPILQKLLKLGRTGFDTLIEVHHKQDLPSKLNQIHKDAIFKFANELSTNSQSSNDFNMQTVLVQAFNRLDEDLSKEIQEFAVTDPRLSALALMGSCASVAHVDGSHLHIANSGDCHAVLGILSDNNKWVAQPLGPEHNAENISEITRIMSEHPKSEINTAIKNERLLGQLAPLRAFGDYTYKWPNTLQQQLLIPMFGPDAIPPNYLTPPYLTVQPEVIHHRLTPRDKFLVIASDGLWEQMMPHEVVKFVGEHMSGKQTLDLLRLPRSQMHLGNINDILLQRRIGLSKKISDTNATTHLLRNALGRTEYGIEHSKLSALLSLPEDLVRSFRDDISIVIIFFDSEYLRHSPAE